MKQGMLTDSFKVFMDFNSIHQQLLKQHLNLSLIHFQRAIYTEQFYFFLKQLNELLNCKNPIKIYMQQ